MKIHLHRLLLRLAGLCLVLMGIINITPAVLADELLLECNLRVSYEGSSEYDGDVFQSSVEMSTLFLNISDVGSDEEYVPATIDSQGDWYAGPGRPASTFVAINDSKIKFYLRDNPSCWMLNHETLDEFLADREAGMSSVAISRRDGTISDTCYYVLEAGDIYQRTIEGSCVAVDSFNAF